MAAKELEIEHLERESDGSINDFLRTRAWKSDLGHRIFMRHFCSFYVEAWPATKLESASHGNG
jgi:hypothetical protein